ncbi:hypothetical protein QBC42DRAFT_266827 [Cladorrhinum samala]|uniref:Uncharacterized protein n=1 Tax=Cladorrhinum samala TaxID=585594 RepID=A0AAV9HSM3_9PEZI|nr:hypothetical protein QBC42DRAFT_266827 [Cladorrhinum samala]
MNARPQITILALPDEGDAQAEKIWAESQESFKPEMIAELPKRSYLFLSREDYKPADGRREKILEHFNVPRFVANETCFDINGFFGSRSTFDDTSRKKPLTSYTTWFRFLIKMIQKVDEDPHDQAQEYATKEKGYRWFETTVFTRWDSSGACQVLCVDAPPDCPAGVLKALGTQTSGLDFRDPFSMHSVLIDQLVAYSDISVWRIRDPVRTLEKTRMRMGAIFEEIHDISRHAIHSSEILEAGVDTLKELKHCQVAVHEKMSQILGKTYIQQAREYTQFQISLLKNLKLRADSNRERLKNEVNLAFNNITRQDNSVLKSIALLTMIFLPATFISALFSTTFFSYGDDSTGWQVSDKMWIYWATTIPATLFIIISWQVWLTYGDAIVKLFTPLQKWFKKAFTVFKKEKEKELEKNLPMPKS